MTSLIILLWACGWVYSLGVHQTRCDLEPVEVFMFIYCWPVYLALMPLACAILIWKAKP